MHRRTIGGPLFGLALLLVSWLAPVPAASQGPIEVRIDELNDSNLPVVRAAVTVTDAAGRPVLGLQGQHFQASAGDVPLSITDAQGAADNDLPMGLVLAFDVSKSMEGAALQQSREGGRALVEQLLPVDQVAVLSFAGGVRVVQPFTADRGALLGAIDGLQTSGDTALYQAVATSGYLAASSGLPRRAVVLLSDGEDFGGHSAVDRATSLEAVRQAGVPVFVVGVGDQIDRPYLEELAAAARTPLLLAPSPDELRSLYSRIGETLRHQYVVTVDATGAPSGEVPFRLTVTYEGATAFAERPLSVPVPPAPPPPPPAVEPVSAPEPASSEGAASPLLPAAAGAAVLLAVVAAGAIVMRRRRRGRRRAEAGLERRAQSLPALEPASASPAAEEGDGAKAAPAVARLLLLNDPTGTANYALREAPATIGSGSDCSIRLRHEQVRGQERVRVWRRDGKFMLHKLSRRGRVAVDGRVVTWAVLEDGDEIEIGPYRLRFRLEPAPGAPPQFLKREL